MMNANEYYLKEIGRHLKKLADDQPTLRDKFAMGVLPALLPDDCGDRWVVERVAAQAYEIADVMLEARNK